MKENLTEICRRFDTDKLQSPGYVTNYETHFGPMRDQHLNIFELGVHHGGSLLAWQDYFPKGQIVGLDINPNPLSKTYDRIRFFQGSQGDRNLLHKIAQECAPSGFDIIIDDAAHVGSLSMESFDVLFEKLKSGGIYVVEDWGTGYWSGWPDGAAYKPGSWRKSKLSNENRSFFDKVKSRLFSKDMFSSHNFGMVGLVKNLVDEVGWDDITHPKHGSPNLLARRASKIKSMSVYHGQVFVIKA